MFFYYFVKFYMFKFFKKKVEKTGLEKALSLNLISKKEFLELKKGRIDDELKNYLDKDKKKK